MRKILTDTVFFVSSSDNTFDVFDIVGEKLAQSLPLVEYELYVGLNKKTTSRIFKVVRAAEGGWAKELSEQIAKLPETVSKIVLILDDFWFYEPFPADYLDKIIKSFDELEADYIRLVPLRRSVVPFIFRSLYNLIKNNGEIERILESEPYYSSLQVAIWKRDHLLRSLSNPVSIWNFEHQCLRGSKHFAVRKTILRYEHFVEKGMWYPFSIPIIEDFTKEKRIQRPINFAYSKSRRMYDRIKFFIFGYSALKLKRLIFKKNDAPK